MTCSRLTQVLRFEQTRFPDPDLPAPGQEISRVVSCKEGTGGSALSARNPAIGDALEETRRGQQMSPPGAAGQRAEERLKAHRPTSRVSIKIRSCTVLICPDFFSICRGSGFSTGSRTFSTQINMGDGGEENRHCFTSPPMIWDQMTCLRGFFGPPEGLPGEIYTLCCGFIQDMCVCAMGKVR